MNAIIFLTVCVIWHSCKVSTKVVCPAKAINGYASEKRLKRHVTQMVKPGKKSATLNGCVKDESTKNTGKGLKDKYRCKYCRSTVGTCELTKYGYCEDLETVPGHRIIATNGIPNHCYEDKQVCENYRAMLVPQYVRVSSSRSKRNSKMKKNPDGPIAILRDGAFMYNNINIGEGCGIPDHLTEKPKLDSCGGHGDKESCMYHYYGLPKCWAAANDVNRCHLMGFMHDGIPIYGKCRIVFDKDGSRPRMRSCYRLKSKDSFGCYKEDWIYDDKQRWCNLDKANGYYFKENATSADGKIKFVKGQYGYFFSKEFSRAPLNYVGKKITYGGDIGDFCGLTPQGWYVKQQQLFYRGVCEKGSFYNNMHPFQVGPGGKR